MVDASPLPPATPPGDIDELLSRARWLAGRTLGELATRADVTLPTDLTRSKGLVGNLLELWLGAGAGNQSVPDFTHLGIELKTLPIDRDGKPLQSTYVTTVPLRNLETLAWKSSTVLSKLRHVMWLPVQAERAIPLAVRVVGQAFLWQPSAEEEQLLCADWEYHIARIRAGDVNEICGGDGAVLQVRPKAPRAGTVTFAEQPDQGTMLTRPCGFYLRSGFTRYLIQRHFYGSLRAAPALRPYDGSRVP